jgi:hypothetical protein
LAKVARAAANHFPYVRSIGDAEIARGLPGYGAASFPFPERHAGFNPARDRVFFFGGRSVERVRRGGWLSIAARKMRFRSRLSGCLELGCLTPGRQIGSWSYTELTCVTVGRFRALTPNCSRSSSDSGRRES